MAPKTRKLAEIDRELQGARAEADQYRSAIEDATRRLAGNLQDEKSVDVIMRAQAKERAAAMRVDLLEQERRAALPATIADGYRAARAHADNVAATYMEATARLNAAIEEEKRKVEAARAALHQASAELAHARQTAEGFILLACYNETQDMNKAEQLQHEVKDALAS
jgi:hypothetical protein